MSQNRIKAVFMRGGTSKAVIFNTQDLPADKSEWDRIFLSVMGSPDPYGRQLDGMGGGISSLSKVCIVGPPTLPGADVDYTFAQVSVSQAVVDYAGNCGNMSAAIGPFAVDERMVRAGDNGERGVVIHNTNTGKLIRARFDVRDGIANVEGNLEIDGVAGSGAPVELEFISPGGSKTGRLLPTSAMVDRLRADKNLVVEVTMVDAANPCVFVSADVLSVTGTESAEQLEANKDLLANLEAIRCKASVAMGLAASEEQAHSLESIPKVAIVFTPRSHRLASGRMLEATDFDLGIRMMSMGRPHRAVPITGAVCLAVAMRLPGSVPNQLMSAGRELLRVGHPSGVIAVGAKVAGAGGDWTAESGSVYRTARRLFEGHVLYT